MSVFALIGVTSAALATSNTVVRSLHLHGGHILGSHDKYALYVYCTGASQNCKQGHSSSTWPPYTLRGQLVAWKGVNKSKLSYRKINGKNIVTYYGEPLYRYKGDKPMQTKGEGKNGTWYVVIASGLEAGQPAPPNHY